MPQAKTKTKDSRVARRVLETAAVLRNFDLETLGLYLPYEAPELLSVLHQHDDYFDRRSTTSRGEVTNPLTSGSGRWLVRDQTELLLHAVSLAEEPDRDSLLSVKGSAIVIDAREKAPVRAKR